MAISCCENYRFLLRSGRSPQDATARGEAHSLLGSCAGDPAAFFIVFPVPSRGHAELSNEKK